jgi:hypothetical protein
MTLTSFEKFGATKNKDGKRDSETHQTAKGQQWYFGLKAHIGLHGQETRVWGDQGYQGQPCTWSGGDCWRPYLAGSGA